MQELTIYGEGKGGGSTPTEANDTLESKQTVRLLFALSEGEIEGVEDILVNSASISNFASTIVTWEQRKGTIDQTVVKGFSDVEAPIEDIHNFPLQLFHGTDYIYTLLGQYSAIRVTLNIDRLEQVTAKGDRVGYEVTLEIYRRKKDAGENWQLVTTTTKKGKCTTTYAWDIRVNKPDNVTISDSWELKVIRVSANDVKDSLMSKTFLASIITITEKTLTYPKTALVGITLKDAKQFGSSVPEIKFKVKGIKLFLPDTYIVNGRHYNEPNPGQWSGAFKSFTEYTDNLAWVIYWSLVQPSPEMGGAAAGFGLNIPMSDVDIGSFYSYAKHCDQLVPAGNSTEPRYTINHQFIERTDVPTYLMTLLTLGNANLSSNDFGQIKIVWDGAGQAITKVVSNATVIDGMFDYTSTDLESRTNLVNVTYARNDFFGASDTASYSEDSLITRYGLQTSDIVLLGCTSEYQALRKAKWALYNNCYSGDLVTFKQLFQGSHYQIGELVNVMDSDNISSDPKHAVVISSAIAGNNVSVVLDREITLSNADYTVEFLGTDGLTFYSKGINQLNGKFSTITFNNTDTPYIGGTILFKTAALPTRTIKVIKIEKDENHIYTITGLTHQEDKYTYIESATSVTVQNPTGSYVNFGNFSVPPISNLVIEQVHVSNGVLDYSKLHVSWDWASGVAIPSDDYSALFEVSYRRDNQEFIWVRDLHVASFDIEYPVPGVYEVYVWAVNPFSGIKSIVTTNLVPYNYRTVTATSSLLPPINVVVPNTAGVAFSQPDLVLNWQYPAANDTKVDQLKDYIIQVLDLATRTVLGTYISTPDTNKNGTFTFPYAENFAIFGTPQRTFAVRIFSRDTIGDLSNYVEVVPNNVVPAVQSFDIISGVSSVYLKITTSPDTDLAGYLVWRSTTANFTKNASTQVYDGPDSYITLNVPTGDKYYYAVAAYDSFGKVGINISGEQNSTPLSADATTWTKTGLQFTVDAVTPNKLNWTAGTIVRNGSYTYTVAAGSATWTTGYLYVYFNPNISGTALQTTTTLLTAVAMGSYPLATYTGGAATNIKGGDGSAFISGSQIIAGTVGASEIKAGSIVASLLDTTNAVITGSAQITDGIITNAMIKDLIMSQNYNPTTHKGWKIDKAGDITSYGSLSLLDSNGNPIFVSGAFNWNNVIGTGVPQAGATRNVFTGNWSAGTSYLVGDIVLDAAGYGWSCVTPHTASVTLTTPTYPATSNSYWTLYTVKGSAGPSGTNSATVFIYQRSATAPALPTATTTYTFSSGVLTGLTGSWTTSVPSGTTDLYVSTAAAVSTGTTDTIASTEWATPVILARYGVDGQPGSPGSPGAAGINTATVYLYQNTTTATPPTALPSADVTYTFATGAITGVNNGWTRSVPATGAYRWMTTATALGTGTTDIITASEWSAMVLLSKDGSSAAYVIVTGEQAFKFAAGQTSPAATTITLTAALYGGLTTYSWEYWNGSTWTALSGVNTNQTYSLAYNNAAFTTNSLRVRCNSSGNYDEITIVKLYDGSNGADSVTVYLTNQTTSLAADNTGLVSSYAPAAGNFKLFKGTTDYTTSATYSVVSTNPASGLTCSIVSNTGAYSFSGTLSTDTVSFTLQASYGGVNYTQIVSISKSKAGLNGQPGQPGTSAASYYGTSDPTSATSGNNGDSYFNSTTQLMWIKVNGTWQKVIPQLTSSNISTFMASAAIGSAQIGSLAVGTLQIMGEAVTVENVISIGAISVTASTSSTTWTDISTYSAPANTVGYATIIDISYPDLINSTTGSALTVSSTSGGYSLRIIDADTTSATYGAVLATFTDTLGVGGRLRYLAKIAVTPAVIKIQRQTLYATGTGRIIYPTNNYSSALMLFRTVKK